MHIFQVGTVFAGIVIVFLMWSLTMYTSQNNPMQMAQYMQQMYQQQQYLSATAGQYTGYELAGYDYISDNSLGDNSEYASEDVAQMFSALTGHNFTAEQIEQKFGKERITDYDLYAVVDNGEAKDGFLHPAEILHFMKLDDSEETTFHYLSDDETSYSLEDVAEEIRQATGKIIDPENLSTLINGRTEMTNFEVMMLLDHNRDGKADRFEMDNLISSFQITYDLDDETDDTDSIDDITSLYRGDGAWSYSIDDFKTRALDEFNIELTDDEITELLGTSITDRSIEENIDVNDDGYISTSELSDAFEYSISDAENINYIGDDTAFYSTEEVAELLSQATGETVTETQVETLTGGETAISDQIMFNLFDADKNGIVETDEAEIAIEGLETETSFNYLADEATSYSPQELATALNGINSDISADDIEGIFGTDTITDSNILEMLDKADPYTAFKDGIITSSDF